MNRRTLKICDWYVHPSHQMELAKLGHTFYFLREEGALRWSTQCRPKPYNTHFINTVIPDEFDLVIAHKTKHLHMVDAWKNQGYMDKDTPVIFIFHYQPPDDDIIEKMIPLVTGCHLVFNSYQSQLSWRMPNKSQRTIIHGFEVDEWKQWTGGTNGVLTVAGRMGQRNLATGYYYWRAVTEKLQCPVMVMGSKWEGATQWENKITRESTNWLDLQNTMSSWDVYFSPTNESPFPRARTEAFITGMPMVTTPNHDANIYVMDGINGFIVRGIDEAVERINQLLSDEKLRNKFSRNAREYARVVMNRERYLHEWNLLLDEVMGRI